MKVLLTGFEPFGGSSINPSCEVVQQLAADGAGGIDLATAILPVVGGADSHAAPTRLRAAITSERPDVVVCLGESKARAAISLERVAINLRDYRIKDNAGQQVRDLPVVPDAPAAYFSTLPLRAMLAAVRSAGAPCELSQTAGLLLCNEIMYHALHLAPTMGVSRAGFIHIPRLPEQCLPGQPSLSLARSSAGIRAALAVITLT